MRQFKFEVLITTPVESIDVILEHLEKAVNFMFEDDSTEVQVCKAGILINDYEKDEQD